jgi:hypothetical protein
MHREANQIVGYFVKNDLNIFSVKIFDYVRAFASLTLTTDASLVVFPKKKKTVFLDKKNHFR